MEADWVDIPQEQKQTNYTAHLKTVSATIDERYGGCLDNLFVKISEYNAAHIANTPEEICTDPAIIHYFFMFDLSQKNQLFEKAIQFMVNKNTKNIKKQVNGETIDTYEQKILQQLTPLKPIIQAYVLRAIKKELQQDYELFTYQHPQGARINCTAINSKRCLGATASYDKTVHVWSVLTGTHIHTLQHSYPVNTVSFSADGSKMITTTAHQEEKNFFYEWNVQTGKLLYQQEILGNCAYHNHRDDSLMTFYWQHPISFREAGPNYTTEITSWRYENKAWHSTKTFKANGRQILHLGVRDNDEYTFQNHCNYIILYKKDHLPTLCYHAFNNSKGNKKALQQLAQSHTVVQKLSDTRKTRLLELITTQLAALKVHKRSLISSSSSSSHDDEVDKCKLRPLKNEDSHDHARLTIKKLPQ